MIEHVQITPIDVLFLRGNQLFGQGAGHSETLMPPWPSVFAGALRSRMLVDTEGALSALTDRGPLPTPLDRILGSIEQPGTFRVSHVALFAGERLVFPLPSDLVVLEPQDGESALRVARASPRSLRDHAIVTNSPLPRVPVISDRAKPRSGYWLDAVGFSQYQRGARSIAPANLVSSSELWGHDFRLGIGLDADRRTAADGMLYTSQAVAMKPGVSFVVGVAGAEGALPGAGLLRLGGDGRGASVAQWSPGAGAALPAPWAFRPSSDRFAVVLASPGLFPDGWALPGLREAGDALVWHVGALRARLLAASIPRHEIVSGWDLARVGEERQSPNGRPKPAERAVPRGAVYWFERTEGDLSALDQLLVEGLWPLIDQPDRARRAEGYNSVWFSEWRDDVRE